MFIKRGIAFGALGITLLFSACSSGSGGSGGSLGQGNPAPTTEPELVRVDGSFGHVLDLGDGIVATVSNPRVVAAGGPVLVVDLTAKNTGTSTGDDPAGAVLACDGEETSVLRSSTYPSEADFRPGRELSGTVVMLPPSDFETDALETCAGEYTVKVSRYGMHLLHQRRVSIPLGDKLSDELNQAVENTPS